MGETDTACVFVKTVTLADVVPVKSGTSPSSILRYQRERQVTTNRSPATMFASAVPYVS